MQVGDEGLAGGLPHAIRVLELHVGQLDDREITVGRGGGLRDVIRIFCGSGDRTARGERQGGDLTLSPQAFHLFTLRERPFRGSQPTAKGMKGEQATPDARPRNHSRRRRRQRQSRRTRDRDSHGRGQREPKTSRQRQRQTRRARNTERNKKTGAETEAQGAGTWRAELGGVSKSQGHGGRLWFAHRSPRRRKGADDGGEVRRDVRGESMALEVGGTDIAQADPGAGGWGVRGSC
jgi:hypothetical protein